MTQMSEPHGRCRRPAQANYLQSQIGSRLARAVHAPGAIVAIATLLALCTQGCVIPPSLRVEDDVPANSPPAIISVLGPSDALAEPGPYFVESGPMAGTLSVSLIDTDVADTLYVRGYLDYNTPTGNLVPPRIRCAVPLSDMVERTTTCNLAGLCLPSDVGTQHNLTLVVFDRPPADSGADPQAMPGTMGGLSTSRFYFVHCQPPQS
jgi:hypothetical protein